MIVKINSSGQAFRNEVFVIMYMDMYTYQIRAHLEKVSNFGHN